MKKFISITLGMVAAAAIVAFTPATVKAEGMPCTEATLKQFEANLTQAQAELAQVQALKAQADAKVAQLKASGVTGLELQQATDAAFNAANVVSMYQYKVINAQASVKAITGRGSVEQYYLNMEEKFKGRCAIDSTKTQLDGANQLTAASLEQLNNLKTALVNQTANAAANPALAANVTAMQAQVAAAEADYAAKKAKSDALAAQYQQQLSTLNWATNADSDAYAKFVKDYGKEFNPQPNEWAIRWFE